MGGSPFFCFSSVDANRDLDLGGGGGDGRAALGATGGGRTSLPGASRGAKRGIKKAHYLYAHSHTIHSHTHTFTYTETQAVEKR